MTSITLQGKMGRIYPPDRSDVTDWRLAKVVPDGIILHFIWVGTLVQVQRAPARIVETEPAERTVSMPRSLLDIAKENETR